MGMCQDCHGGCCRSFAVPVTGADILKLISDNNLNFWQFVCRWADPEGEIALQHAPQFHFADAPDVPFVICLLPQPSQYFPGTSKCCFLEEEAPTAERPLGRAKCGVYNSRPGTCRAFPTRLNATSELAVLYDVPARGRDDDHPLHQLCPRPWEPSDVNPLSQIQDLVLAQYEMNFFHGLAALWNAQPGPWRAFPEFLNLVYASRIRPASEADSADERIADQDDGYQPLRIAA